VAFLINRDAATTDLIIRITEDAFSPINPRGMAEGMITEIRSFLVVEFINTHGNNIIKAINPRDIAVAIEPMIAERLADFLAKKEK
jgi:hypothetical protein